nr:FAD-binding oxidoreductase [Micromonospora sp. DSM 115978]
MTDVELPPCWAAVLADGADQAARRFWARFRPRTSGMFRAAEHVAVFATLDRLTAGGDDPAGRAAARAVLGRWIRRHGLLPEHLRTLGAALSAVLAETHGRSWPAASVAAWDTAYRETADALLAVARRSGTGPAWWSAELVGRDRPADGTAILTVRPDRPLPFRPGQAVPVGLPGAPGGWRWYCPANAPRRDGTIDLHVRAVGGGLLSPWLVERSAVGDRLWLGPASGRGLVPGRTGRRDLLLIAGGTGLAPLRAIVEQVIDAGPDGREVILVVGARSVEQLYDAVTLDRWQDAHDWLTVLPAFSDDPSAHPVERGPAVRIALRHEGPDHDVFLCGPTAMIHDALPRLVIAGVPLARIHLPETYDDQPRR